MALIRTRKTLANATLTGGARVVASGGGFPQRITTAADAVFVGATETRGGVVFDPDGLHVWTNKRTAGTIVKIRISDGATIATLTCTGGSPENISRALGSTKIYSTNTTTVFEVDTGAVTITNYTNPVSAAFHVVEGNAGTAWSRTGNASNGAYSEFTLSTGTLTGRSLTASWDLVYDKTNNKLYRLLGSTGAVEKLNEGTLVSEFTWSAWSTGTVNSIPFHSPGMVRALCVDSARRPIVAAPFESQVYRYQSGVNALDKRLFAGAAELGHPVSATMGNARQQHAFMAFSDTDSKMAWLQANSSGAISDALDIRVVTLTTQAAPARARWSLPVGANPVTVKEITAPGATGNNYFPVDTPPNGQITSHDNRRVRWYYAISGGARTEFNPGDDLSIAVAGNGTLEIDADMSVYEAMLLAPPFVGGTSGEGIGVVWDDGIGGGDTNPPVVTNIVNPPNAQGFWECDVYDITPGFLLFQVLVQLGNEADMLVAYDAAVFKGRFAMDSTRTGLGTQATPYHLKVRPVGGWPAGATHSIVGRFIDGAANQTV